MAAILSILAFVQANAAAFGLIGGALGVVYAARNTTIARRILSLLSVQRSLHEYRRAQIERGEGELYMAATDSTPEIDFRFLDGKLSVRGPLATGSGRLHSIFEKVGDSLRAFLKQYHGPLEFVFELEHLPSMAQPDILDLVRMLAHAECTSVVVRWKCSENSKIMMRTASLLKEMFESERKRPTYVFSIFAT